MPVFSPPCHTHTSDTRPKARQKYLIYQKVSWGPQNNETIVQMSQAYEKHVKHVADFQLKSKQEVYVAGFRIQLKCAPGLRNWGVFPLFLNLEGASSPIFHFQEVYCFWLCCCPSNHCHFSYIFVEAVTFSLFSQQTNIGIGSPKVHCILKWDLCLILRWAECQSKCGSTLGLCCHILHKNKHTYQWEILKMTTMKPHFTQ